MAVLPTPASPTRIALLLFFLESISISSSVSLSLPEILEERLTKQELFLDDDAVRSARQDIRTKQEEYQQRLQNGQQALIEKQKELLEPIIEEVKTLIEEIGESENYSLILDQRLTVGAYSIPVALYVSSKYDLTDRIIKKLNDKYNKPAKETEKQ